MLLMGGHVRSTYVHVNVPLVLIALVHRGSSMLIATYWEKISMTDLVSSTCS